MNTKKSGPTNCQTKIWIPTVRKVYRQTGENMPLIIVGKELRRQLKNNTE